MDEIERQEIISREDRHLIRMFLKDRIATSRALNCLQKNKCLHEQLDDACNNTDSQLGDHGFGYPWYYITDRNVFIGGFNVKPGCQNGMTEFSNEFQFCFHHYDTCMRIWWHRGERSLPAYIQHWHTRLSPGVMVRDTTGYTSRSPFVHIDGTVKSGCYISFVLRPW